MGNYAHMADAKIGFGQFIASVLGKIDKVDKDIADRIQAQAERKRGKRILKKVRVSAKHKPVQKALAGIIAIGSIAAAPFTGGLSAAAGLALAAGIVLADKGVARIKAFQKAPDKLKSSAKSLLSHLDDVAKHAARVAVPDAKDKKKGAAKGLLEVEIEGADEVLIEKVDPGMGRRIFKYAHHVYKATERLKELQDEIDGMAKILKDFQENCAEVVEECWPYVRQVDQLSNAIAKGKDKKVEATGVFLSGKNEEEDSILGTDLMEVTDEDDNE